MQFFRKIRRRLLAKNKLSKYLTYALGEIVLVVLGILIALAINNSQQNRILAKKEQIYLEGLRSEFETSKTKLANLLSVNKQNYTSAKQLLEFMANPDELPTEKRFSYLLFQSFYSDIAFNPNNSLLLEMISSGSLKDLSNTELRIQLTNWISTLDDIYRQEEELADQREKVLDLFRNNENSIRTIFEHTNSNREISFPKRQDTLSNLNLLRSVAFENNMIMFYLTSYATETSHYGPLMEELNTILELIEGELKRE